MKQQNEQANKASFCGQMKNVPLAPFWTAPWESEAMRLSGSADPTLPALHSLALILAAVTPAVWGVAGLTLLVRGVLVLALSAPLSLVLAPVVFACRSWLNWRWNWLFRPAWLLDSWSWLCRCWLRWPWLCWNWLR